MAHAPDIGPSSSASRDPAGNLPRGRLTGDDVQVGGRAHERATQRPVSPEGKGLVTCAAAREALSRFEAPGRMEEVALEEVVGRVAFRDVAAPHPFPPFRRAQMDGYAVRAEDTLGAGETRPRVLELDGRVAMGSPAGSPLRAGRCRAVTTGGALPEGADAVVMIEDAREAGGISVEIRRAAGAGEHILAPGEDLAAGARILAGGTRVLPHHLPALAAFGLATLEAHARPRVLVVSTGDELVEVTDEPLTGQMRDQNRSALAAQVREAGGIPVDGGWVRDDPVALRYVLERWLPTCDLAIVSGGSSSGAHDHTAAVLQALGPPGVLVHGIEIAPGKPTLFAAAPREGGGEVPLIGLPGHPVSSFIVFRLFVSPLIRRLGGEAGPCNPFPGRRRARLARGVAGKPGFETYVRVRLQDQVAEPLTGVSGALSSLLSAEGCVVIPAGVDRLDSGAEVEVLLF